MAPTPYLVFNLSSEKKGSKPKERFLFVLFLHSTPQGQVYLETLSSFTELHTHVGL